MEKDDKVRRIAGGSGALNQYIERRFDAQMRRTARPPLAAGKIER